MKTKMNRRNFLIEVPAITGFAAAALTPQTTSAAAPRVPRKNTKMHVCGDYHAVVGGKKADMATKANLEYNLRHGIRHLTIRK